MAKAIGQWLLTPFDHVIRFEDGHLEHVSTVDGLPQGCPSAPLAFSLGLKRSIDRFWERLGEERGIPATDIHKVKLFRYLDDITLITPPSVANKAFEILSTTLTEEGMLLNEENALLLPRTAADP